MAVLTLERGAVVTCATILLVQPIRAFFCIELDAATRRAIGAIAERLRGQVKMRASWVKDINYHVTVRFLGDIDAMSTLELESAARSVCTRLRPFSMNLRELGAFPSMDRARVLWIGDEEAPAFRGLSSSLDGALRPLGFARERKDALAHVTLARIKARPDPRLGVLLGAAQPDEPFRVPVDRLTLMQSELAPDGAVYTPLFTTRLGGASSDGD